MTIGFKQIWLAIREIRSLPQTFLYFFAYFLLADGLNTTGKFTPHMNHVSSSWIVSYFTDSHRYSRDYHPK